MLVVKQHGGETGTGAACAEIIREVNDAGIKVNYDAGNVMDYLDVDPIPDLRACADEVRSFCIKDHRNFPARPGLRPGLRRDRPLQAAAPGRLHRPHDARCAARTSSPRCCPGPRKPDGVDALARRAREFLEIVTKGLQTEAKSS